MKLTSNEQQREARRSTLYLSIITFLVAMSGIPLALHLDLSGIIFKAIAGASALIFLIALFIPSLPRILSLMLFVFLGLTQLYASHTAQNYFAARMMTFPAFAGYKAAILIMAVIASSGWTGALMIVLWTADAFYLFYSWTPAVRILVPSIEPWFTALVGAIAAFILRGRRKLVTLYQEAERAKSQNAWLEYVAHFILMVRDLTNTPIQTLIIANQLLAATNQKVAPIVKRMDDRISEFIRLNRASAPLDPFVKPKKGITSFDALADIQNSIKLGPPLPIGRIESKSPEHEAFTAAMRFSMGTTAIGLLGAILYQSKNLPSLAWLPTFLAGLVGLTILAIRYRVKRNLGLTIISVQTGVSIVASILAQEQLVQTKIQVPPFDLNKFIMILIFLVIPSWKVGRFLLLAATLAPIAQYTYWLTSRGEIIRSLIPFPEPWVTGIIGMSCFVGLYLRRRQIDQLRKDSILIAEKLWLRHFVEILLSIRQLSTSLLQANSEDIDEISKNPEVSSGLTKNMRSALNKLQELNNLLAPIGSEIGHRYWKSLRTYRNAPLNAMAVSEDFISNIEVEIRECLKLAQRRHPNQQSQDTQS